jgi:hypothetical protein
MPANRRPVTPVRGVDEDGQLSPLAPDRAIESGVAVWDIRHR